MAQAYTKVGHHSAQQYHFFSKLDLSLHPISISFLRVYLICTQILFGWIIRFLKIYQGKQINKVRFRCLRVWCMLRYLVSSDQFINDLID